MRKFKVKQIRVKAINRPIEKMESGEKEYTTYKSLEEFRLPAEPEP